MERRRVSGCRAWVSTCAPNWEDRNHRLDNEQVECCSSIPSAILKGRHDVAREMIACADQSAINYALDGCTALNACFISMGHPRNFQIACMLLAKGARINFRYNMRPKTSNPFESLIVFYTAVVEAFEGHGGPEYLTKDCICCTTCEDLLQTIGLDGKPISSPVELLSQAKTLIRIFLEQGANPNLPINGRLWTPFFLLCMSNNAGNDGHLVDLFLRFNASLSGSDIDSHPLAAHVAARDLTDGARRLRWIKSYYKRLARPVLTMDIGENQFGRQMERPSFMCMIFSNIECAKVFMEGANLYWFPALVERVPSKRPVQQGRYFRVDALGSVILMLPIFAPFLYNSAAMNNSFDVLRKFSDIIKCCISPLVDEGMFCEQGHDVFLRSFIRATKFPHLYNIVVNNYDLVRVMFGNVSAGLTQLCIRKMLYKFLFDDQPVEVIKILAQFMERPLSPSTLEAIQNSKMDNSFLSVDFEKIRRAVKKSTLCCIRKRAGFDECFVKCDNKKNQSAFVNDESSNDTSEASDSLSQNSTSSRVDSSWGGGAFSLRLTTAATIEQVTKKDLPHYLSMESIIMYITPSVAKKISHYLGIPFGLHNRVELEIAKLQLIICTNAYRFNYTELCGCSVPVNTGMNPNLSDSTDDELPELPRDSV